MWHRSQIVVMPNKYPESIVLISPVRAWISSLLPPRFLVIRFSTLLFIWQSISSAGQKFDLFAFCLHLNIVHRYCDAQRYLLTTTSSLHTVTNVLKMYKFQGVDSHHFYWRTCTDVLSKIKSSWDNGNNVLGMPSFREVFYGHKKKNYVYACGKWQKLSFCCLFFSQGRINLKIFSFVVKRKWFLLFC